MGKFTTLEKSKLVAGWTLEERSALAHFLQEKTCGEGQSLFLTRSPERSLFFVDSGLIRITYENISLELESGSSFGELSLFQPAQKLISATAVKESVLWFLSFEKWEELRKVAPAVSVKLMEASIQKFAGLLSNMVPPPRMFAPSPAKTN